MRIFSPSTLHVRSCCIGRRIKWLGSCKKWVRILIRVQNFKRKPAKRLVEMNSAARRATIQVMQCKILTFSIIRISYTGELFVQTCEVPRVYLHYFHIIAIPPVL